jgi:DNA-directed RNA polymerase alpha subunit
MPRFSFSPKKCDEDHTPMNRCSHCMAVDLMRAGGLDDDSIRRLGELSERYDHMRIESSAEGNSVDDLNLPAQLKSSLKAGGVWRIDQFGEMQEEQLLDISNVGRVNLREIRAALDEKGIKLKPSPSINVLALGEDIEKILNDSNIMTIPALTRKTDKELLALRGFEPNHLERVSSALSARGQSLKPMPEDGSSAGGLLTQNK